MKADRQRTLETSLGWLGLIASPSGLKAVIGPHETRSAAESECREAFGALPDAPPGDALDTWAEQLIVYAGGGDAALDGSLDLDAGTPFQRDVWRALRAIPVGGVRSYGDIARAIGRPAAARAVGQAVGANPLSIVVP